MAVDTVERVAALTATLHDGKNMIVLSQGKKVTVAKSSLAFLTERNALVPEGGDAAAETAPAQSDDEFVVPDGYHLTEKGGGWYEITGPEGFGPVKARGVDDVRAELAMLTAAPDEGDGGEAPAS